MVHFLENLRRLLVYYAIRIQEELGHYDINEIKFKLRKALTFEQFLFFDDKFRVETEYLPFENLRLLNNKWGRKKLKEGEIYHQEMYKIHHQYGFEFMPPKRNRGVLGYAELACGISPWGGESSDEYFPIKVKKIKSLKATYDVDMVIQPKKYNLSYDFWLMYSTENRPSNIAHEIMVWEDRNVARPFGKHIKTIKTSFGTYKVYHGYMDRSEENLGTNGWYFTAFVRQDRRRSGTVDVKELLNKMAELELISGCEYFCGFEFGTEVYNSCGYCKINKFEIEKS